MRILKFIVEGQTIRKDPQCDFTNIVKGSAGYLKAEFMFDKEWSGTGKIAVFEKLSKEYPEKIRNNTCLIPENALTWNYFNVRVIGVKPGMRIVTNKTEVKQIE